MEFQWNQMSEEFTGQALQEIGHYRKKKIDHLWQSIQCYLSGGSVDVACGAVLWVAGHLTSLVPAHLMSGAPPASTRVDVWGGQGFRPFTALSLVPGPVPGT